METIIVDGSVKDVLPKREFDDLYDRGWQWEGFYCQKCQAWHPWEGYDAYGSPREGSHCQKIAK